MFFKITEENKNHYQNYKYESCCDCFMDKYLKKGYSMVKIPNYIHPNIVTLSGLLFMMLGYTLSTFSGGNLFFGLGVFLYMSCDYLDGMHARRTNQSSIIGEYLDHLVDLVVVALIADGVMDNHGITNNFNKSMIILLSNLNFMVCHFKSIKYGYISFNCNPFNFTDTNSILLGTILLSFFNINLSILNTNYLYLILVPYFITLLSQINHKEDRICNINVKNKNELFKISVIINFYYLIKFLTIFYIHDISLISFGIVDVLLFIFLNNYKIFNIKLNPLILLIPILYYYLPNIVALMAVSTTSYILQKISDGLNLELIKFKRKRIYCCGVFDLCHLGHLKFLEKCSEFGDVYVGVHSDKVCTDYKRKPIVHEKFRYDVLRYSKNVKEVITDAPLILTDELLDKYDFDYVAISEEFRDNGDMYYYGPAMKRGIHIYVERYKYFSTSMLIRKIKNEFK